MIGIVCGPEFIKKFVGMTPDESAIQVDARNHQLRDAHGDTVFGCVYFDTESGMCLCCPPSNPGSRAVNPARMVIEWRPAPLTLETMAGSPDEYEDLPSQNLTADQPALVG